MARPKLPLAKARLTGAAAKNPQRYAGLSEPTVTEPIGPAPVWLPRHARMAWDAFCAELPWLAKSDRGILEAASILRGQFQGAVEAKTLSLPMVRELRAHLSLLGATPVDRNKIHHVPPPEGDEWDEFFDA